MTTHSLRSSAGVILIRGALTKGEVEEEGVQRGIAATPGSPMTNRTDEGLRRSNEVDTRHVAVDATAT